MRLGRVVRQDAGVVLARCINLLRVIGLLLVEPLELGVELGRLGCQPGSLSLNLLCPLLSRPQLWRGTPSTWRRAPWGWWGLQRGRNSPASLLQASAIWACSGLPTRSPMMARQRGSVGATMPAQSESPAAPVGARPPWWWTQPPPWPTWPDSAGTSPHMSCTTTSHRMHGTHPRSASSDASRWCHRTCLTSKRASLALRCGGGLVHTVGLVRTPWGCAAQTLVAFAPRCIEPVCV